MGHLPIPVFFCGHHQSAPAILDLKGQIFGFSPPKNRTTTIFVAQSGDLSTSNKDSNY
jgi:hypothetical protein